MQSEVPMQSHRESEDEVPHCSTPSLPHRHLILADALKRVPTTSSINYFIHP